MRRRGAFWAGRNGTDALSLATSVIACVLLIVTIFIGGILSGILWLLALVFLAITYIRMLSRNIARRQAENRWYLERIRPVTQWMNRRKTKKRQKHLYCFFKCPQCSTVLRVPKGKGHIRITCKSCGHVFERNC